MDLNAQKGIPEGFGPSGKRRSNRIMQSAAAANRTQVHPGASPEARMEIKAVLVSDRGRRPHDQSKDATFHGKSNASFYAFVRRRPQPDTHRAGPGDRRNRRGSAR